MFVGHARKKNREIGQRISGRNKTIKSHVLHLFSTCRAEQNKTKQSKRQISNTTIDSSEQSQRRQGIVGTIIPQPLPTAASTA